MGVDWSGTRDSSIEKITRHTTTSERKQVFSSDSKRKIEIVLYMRHYQIAYHIEQYLLKKFYDLMHSL